MSRSYFTYEENEAYREGRRDEERHRHNFGHDRHSDDAADQAYFQGRKDEEKEERAREEDREQQEAYEREVMRRREEERIREEEEYNQYLQAQIDQQMEDERAYAEAMASGEIQSDFALVPEYEPQIDELQPDEMSPEEYAEAFGTPCSEEELFMHIQEDERNETNPTE